MATSKDRASLSETNLHLIGKYFDKPEKYGEYQKALNNEAEIPYGRTIQQALDLLSKCKDKKVRQVAEKIRGKQIVILFDDMGANHGQINSYSNWRTETGPKGNKYDVVSTVLIKVGSQYKRSALATAGVLAHELRHLLDMELEKNGQLNIGVIGNMDSSDAQHRADTYSGYVLNKLGYRKFDPPLTAAQIQKLKKIWGEEWNDTAGDLNYKISMIRDFYKLTQDADPKKRPEPQVCGRPCNNPKYGLCDRKVYFPPCWDH